MRPAKPGYCASHRFTFTNRRMTTPDDALADLVQLLDERDGRMYGLPPPKGFLSPDDVIGEASRIIANADDDLPGAVAKLADLTQRVKQSFEAERLAVEAARTVRSAR